MDTADSPLLCRLLCAAEATYGIQPRKSFVKLQPYYDGAGFIDTPTVIAGGANQIDAALVGENVDGIVVAFRGTLAPKAPTTVSILLDWLQNFMAIPETADGFPGRVHPGFLAAVLSLWPQILQTVQALSAGHPEAKIYVTGHSKGGALASLGAWLLHNHGLHPTQVVTFASPNTGTTGFAAAYNGALNQLRYENYLDIVPFVPPESEWVDLLARIPQIGRIFREAEDWNYEPLGGLHYIQKDGTVIGDSSKLRAKRIAEIGFDIAVGKLPQVLQAHSLVKYSLGYCRSVCPEDLCRG